MKPGSPPQRQATSVAGRLQVPGDRPPGEQRPGFVAIWVIATGLWTAATLLRMQQVWVPAVGRPAVLGDARTWVELFLPPWIFAIILLG